MLKYVTMSWFKQAANHHTDTHWILHTVGLGTESEWSKWETCELSKESLDKILKKLKIEMKTKKIKYAKKPKPVAHNYTSKSHWQSGQSPLHIWVFLLRMMPFGLEFPFGSWGHLSQLCPPNSLCIPNLLTGGVRSRKRLGPVQALPSNTKNIRVLSTPSATQNQTQSHARYSEFHSHPDKISTQYYHTLSFWFKKFKSLKKTENLTKQTPRPP